MSTFWDRTISLQLGNSSQSIDLTADKGNPLRCRFNIVQNVIQEPDTLDCRVTNLSDQTQNLIQKEFDKVQVTLGYRGLNGDGMSGLFFKGQTKWYRKGRESPTDTYFDIQAAASDKAYNYAIVNKTLPSGSTPMDQLQTALKAMQAIDPNIKLGLVTPDLSTPKYPRAMPLYGMAKNIVRNVALLKKATWNLWQDQLQLVGKTDTLHDDAILLNATSGLIGRAVQRPDGIYARCLINPNIKPHSVVIIDQNSIDAAAVNQLGGGPAGLDTQTIATLHSQNVPNIAADGRYKVIHMDVHGDTRGTDWYMDLYCIQIGGPSNKAEAEISKNYASPDSSYTKDQWLPQEGQ